MEGHIWILRPSGFYERYGPYRVNRRDPMAVMDAFEQHDPLRAEAWGGVAGSLTPGDRVVIGNEVWELGQFGQLESIASGPAGDGIIGAMRDRI